MTTNYFQPTDEQVSVRAYYLWERDGRPQNRDWDYWLRAKEELMCENSRASNPAPALGESKSAPKKKSRVAAFA